MTRLIAVTLLSSAALTLPLAAQQPEFETTRIADGAYQFRFRGHQGFFVVTPAGVVAVDPINTTAAEQYAAEIKRVAPGQPLRAIVYSHDHADHATGARVLQAAFGGYVPIVAHVNATAKLVELANADLPVPDLTFTDRLTLHFGGRPLEFHYLGKSHSDNMIVAYLPQDKVAFAVDFVSNDRVGFRSLPDYHFPDFFDALGRLQQLDFETIVFGHGPPGDRGAIERQVSYYSDLRAAVAQAIQDGWSEDEAAERVRLPAYQEWGAYDEWFPLNVRAVYQWMAGQGGR